MAQISIAEIYSGEKYDERGDGRVSERRTTVRVRRADLD